jgi:hypothetical protein
MTLIPREYEQHILDAFAYGYGSVYIPWYNLFENIKEETKMNETIAGSVNCGTLSTAGMGNAFWGQGIIGETSKFRPIKIDRVANGFIVEIGCKKFVGTSWDVVAKQLGEYWKDPVAAEKKYVK